VLVPENKIRQAKIDELEELRNMVEVSELQDRLVYPRTAKKKITEQDIYKQISEILKAITES